MKRVLKKVARAAGYEITRVSRQEPLSWVTPTEPPDDAGDWRTGVLALANQRHRPEHFGSSVVRDARLHYVTWFLDVRDARVLELGPLEGLHSVALDKLGIRAAVAIDARPENLDKCRHVRDLYGLDRTEFLRHDIEALASGREEPTFEGPFDLVFCLGVLYHLRDPPRALAWMASQAPALFLGTHYVERADERWYPDRLFSDCELESGGQRYEGKRFRESPRSPAGGLAEDAFWLDEESLMRALRTAGFSAITVLGREPISEFPHITLLAERSPAHEMTQVSEL